MSSPESRLTDFSVNEVLIDLDDPPLLVGMKVEVYF